MPKYHPPSGYIEAAQVQARPAGKTTQSGVILDLTQLLTILASGGSDLAGSLSLRCVKQPEAGAVCELVIFWSGFSIRSKNEGRRLFERARRS